MPASTPRLSRIAQAVRFVRVARLLLWTLWTVYRERRRVVRAHERGDVDVKPNVDVLIAVLTDFKRTALKLGVLLIKLGQFLSSRADLLPEEALAVLGSLQDEVPAAPFSHVQAVVEAELGQPIDGIFSSFEREATAAASLGQVHRAVLASTGQTVAVKVQRPNIQRLVDMDLASLRFVIWVVMRFRGSDRVIDLPGFYREFQRTVYEEIDYVREAANAKRFQEMFDGKRSIVIPAVHAQYVSRRVLVLDWIDGIKINARDDIEAAGISRVEAARQLIEAYLYQFFEVGFFHADPHPGNIFVQPGAARGEEKLALVDFGMVGSLTKSAKQSLKNLFLGFLANNPALMAEALDRLGFIGEGANMAAIQRGIGLVLERYHGISLGQARDLDFSDVASELEGLLYGQPFRIPAAFAFTGKAIGTLAGVTTGLAPELNLIDVALPYAQRFLGLSGSNPEEMVQRLMGQLFEAGRILLTMPGTLERVLVKMDSGQLDVGLSEAPRARGRRRRMRPSEARPAGAARVAMFALALTGGVVLTMTGFAVPAWFCLGLAGLTALGVGRA